MDPKLTALLLLLGCSGAKTDDTAQDAPPSVRSVHIEPAVLTEASVATCVPEGWWDPEGAPEAYRYTWTVNGVEAHSDDQLDGTRFSRDDRVACAATPYDASSDGETVFSAPVIVANSAPRVAAVALEPDPVTAAGPVRAVPERVEDDDGDVVRFALTWSVDGAEASSDEALDPSWFSRGQVVSVTLVPMDDTLMGAPVQAEAVVANAPPTVLAVGLVPLTPTTDDLLRVEVQAEDADGDRFTTEVRWTVDGLEAGADRPTLDGGRWFERGQEVAATVTLSDGVDATEVVVGPVVVANTPPTAAELGLSPEVPRAGQRDLVCEVLVEATDADGDPVAYTFAWTIDGAPFTDTLTTTHAGDTVPAEALGEGEVVACTVTPDDGTDAGPSATETATVGPALPDLVLTTGSLTLTAGTWQYNEVDISGGTLLIEGLVTIEAERFTVGRGGLVDGSGGGDAGGGPTQLDGSGPGGGLASRNAGSGGGGYGGDGGDGGYDSNDQRGFGGSAHGASGGTTLAVGSGGAGSSTALGGAGGAALRVIAPSITVAGTIRMDGEDGGAGVATCGGSGRCGGGGSGGGLLLRGDVLSLTGTLSAAGGDGQDGITTSHDSGGGGGGGRVKVLWDTSLSRRATIDVSGGIGGPWGDVRGGQDGASGTYAEAQTPWVP